MRRSAVLVLACFAAVFSQACVEREAVNTATRRAGPQFATIVAGNMFTCALDRDSALWCWGANTNGQLGVGDRDDRVRPVRVVLSSPLTRITTGQDRVCAIDANAVLRCWGDNTAFALADSTVPHRTLPTEMPFPSARHVAAGVRFTCATDSTGSAWCWGGDRSGELGDGGDTLTKRIRAERVATSMRFDSLVAGRTHACGLTAEGQAWCWGGEGLAGDGSRDKRTAPVAVSGGHRFRSLTAGQGVTCGVDVEEHAWCWGVSSDGQLGAGAPLSNNFVPVSVHGGHRFRQLAAGYHRVCGLTHDGRAWCWGSNYRGALGDTGRLGSPVPVEVRGGRRFVSIASGDSHACAIDEMGQAWCWGQNRVGEGGGALGDGTIEDRAFPVAVSPPDSVGDTSAGAIRK